MTEPGDANTPAIDLRMQGGHGYIRGTSGTEDSGSSFERAKAQLAKLASRQPRVDWTIDVNLEFGTTPGMLRFSELLDALDDTVALAPATRNVRVNWTMNKDDVSLIEWANGRDAHLKERKEKQKRAKGLVLNLRLE